MMHRIIASLIGFALIITGVILAFTWTVCRVYVHADECLVLVAKTGDPMPADRKIAEPGQKGIQREALGPGRYFRIPLAKLSVVDQAIVLRHIESIATAW